MTLKKNLFSDFIWLLTAILIIGLFYHGVTPMLTEALGLEYLKSVVAVVLLFIAILLIALVFRLIVIKLNKSELKENKLIGILASLLVIVAFVVGRILLYNSQVSLIHENELASNFFLKSFIGTDGKAYVNFDSVQNIHSMVVSVCFKFLGNTAIGVYAANTILAFIGFILFYFAIKVFFGGITAFIMGIGMSFLPVFTGLELGSSYFLTEFLLFSICFYLVALAYKSSNKLNIYYPILIVASFICGLLFLYDAVCLCFLPILIIVSIIGDKKIAIKISSVIISALFWLLGFEFSYILELVNGSYTFDRVINESVRIFTSGYFDPNVLKDIYKLQDICILLTASILYLFAYVVSRYDISYILGSAFIVTVASSVYYILPDVYTYSYILAALLLALVADGITKILLSKKKEKISLPDDNVVDGFKISEILEDNEADEDNILNGAIDDIDDEPDGGFYTAQRAQEEGPQAEDDLEAINFSINNLDWAKLSEAKLIDYPEEEPEKLEEPVKENEDNIAEVEIFDFDIKAKIKRPNLKRYNKVSDNEFDYEVTEKDMHFDIDVKFD